MHRDENELRETLVMVLAGGQGERLYPLTKDRAKPAVPFGGLYRIVDFSLSNCLNSGLRKIAVLTQYKSISLDRHTKSAWNIFNRELGEFIECIPPQLRLSSNWYLGTADAIYQNIYTLEQERPERVLILSGDHVYRMDYRKMIRFHIEKEADLTVASLSCPIEDARRFGVMAVDEDMRIVEFNEKPENPTPMPGDPTRALINMGVYLFRTASLVMRASEDARRNTSHDFGKDVIPAMIATDRVYAYDFKDDTTGQAMYWRDIGTLDAYWQANMDLLRRDVSFGLYDTTWPVRTLQNQYPPAKLICADGAEAAPEVADSLVSHGCTIEGARVRNCILSPGVKLGKDAEVVDSIVLNDVRIGSHARISRSIIDKRVIIPDGAEIGTDLDRDRRRFTVSDGGIVVVPKEMPLA